MRVFASAIPLALVTGWSIPTAIVVMGIVTMVYTWFGGFKAVVWTDVMQLTVYLAGGVATLFIAWRLAGGAGNAFTAAALAGKLRIIDPRSTSPRATPCSAASSAERSSRAPRTAPIT